MFALEKAEKPGTRSHFHATAIGFRAEKRPSIVSIDRIDQRCHAISRGALATRLIGLAHAHERRAVVYSGKMRIRQWKNE